MSIKEWKSRELFHLLMEKFNLKLGEGFVVTGTGEDEDSGNYIAPSGRSFSDQAANVQAWKDYGGERSGTSEFQPSTTTRSSPGDFESNLSTFKQAISTQESGGDYNIEGIPVNVEGNPKSKYEKGEKAKGKYQIMPTNWRAWSKAAGLPEEFQDPYAPGAYSPENQEKVADYQFRYYYNKYNTEGAEPDEVWRKMAIAWYGGEGGVRKVERGEGNKPVYHQGTDKPFPSISSYADDPEEGIIARMNKIRQGK